MSRTYHHRIHDRGTELAWKRWKKRNQERGLPLRDLRRLDMRTRIPPKAKNIKARRRRLDEWYRRYRQNTIADTPLPGHPLQSSSTPRQLFFEVEVTVPSSTLKKYCA